MGRGSLHSLALMRDDLGDNVNDLLDKYPAYTLCGYCTAEMVLGDGTNFIDRGILLKLSDAPSPDGRTVFLDSNDLRLVHWDEAYAALDERNATDHG